MNNERFSHHEPCPKCGSKDNLGVWADGHKFCFGCKYHEASPDSIDVLRRRLDNNKNMEKNKNGSGIIDSSSFTRIIPARALEWLKKYSISALEIQHYNLLWDIHKESLVFPLFDESGQIILTNSRYFGDDPGHPKYITNGHKAENTIFIKNNSTPDSLVLVEDFVSALKVARFASCLPLFGVTISASVVKWASGRFKHIRVWLDMDKASQSLLEASKMSQYVPDTRVILTPLDPKEYSNNDILSILVNHTVLNAKKA